MWRASPEVRWRKDDVDCSDLSPLLPSSASSSSPVCNSRSPKGVGERNDRKYCSKRTNRKRYVAGRWPALKGNRRNEDGLQRQRHKKSDCKHLHHCCYHAKTRLGNERGKGSFEEKTTSGGSVIWAKGVSFSVEKRERLLRDQNVTRTPRDKSRHIVRVFSPGSFVGSHLQESLDLISGVSVHLVSAEVRQPNVCYSLQRGAARVSKLGRELFQVKRDDDVCLLFLWRTVEILNSCCWGSVVLRPKGTFWKPVANWGQTKCFCINGQWERQTALQSSFERCQGVLSCTFGRFWFARSLQYELPW